MYLFVNKKSVSKRKVCIIFIKNLKLKKKNQKKKNPIFIGFFRWVFWVFLGGFFCVGFLMPTLLSGHSGEYDGGAGHATAAR
jgi:hypothetical protein